MIQEDSIKRSRCKPSVLRRFKCSGLFLIVCLLAESLAFVERGWRVNTRGHQRKHKGVLFAVDSSKDQMTSPGLYRKFWEHGWKEIQESGLFQDMTLPSDLEQNEAPAKGMKDSVVKITTRAMTPSEGNSDLVLYARMALLETVSTTSGESLVQSRGIQVLNFVIIPASSTSLPVLGIDLVTLPGGKNLLLLDAQPMIHPNPYEECWKDWHESCVVGNSRFPWGGDFPEPVQKYVSKYALWTRLTNSDEENTVDTIQNDVYDAFVGHLERYLNLLQECRTSGQFEGTNHQPSYLDYRRNNDPAKPMLNSLYGLEWTNRILDEVLFPQ